MKLMQFLMGLDDSLCKLEVLFSLEKFYLMQGEGSALVCENYGFNGHSIDRCFKIIGYPPDFKKKNSGQNFNGKNISNNNSVGTSSSNGFTDKQMATILSLIKDNKIGKNVQVNMAGTAQVHEGTARSGGGLIVVVVIGVTSAASQEKEGNEKRESESSEEVGW
ncbi:hypothetical protein Tco_0563374 [Tanacetum coccineum]